MKIALLFALAMSCSSEAQAPVRPPEPAADPPAEVGGPSAPNAEPSAAPSSLSVGAPAAAFSVPAPPGFSLPITDPGEYRITVTARGEADPALHLYREGTLVADDDDGGAGTNASATLFLEPGTYSLGITERQGRPFDADVRAELMAPLPTELAVTIGEPLVVTFPELPMLRHAENDRDAARAVSLPIATAGNYHCVARMDNVRFVRMQLILNGRVVATATQRLTELNAGINTELAAGNYELRVWDTEYRGDMRATIRCDAESAGEQP